MIIIRKPKFMRSDSAMRAHLFVARTCARLASNTDDVDKQYEYLRMSGELINKAVKDGGFFSVNDMIRWLDMQEKEA